MSEAEEDAEFEVLWQRLEEECRSKCFTQERPKFYAFLSYLEGKKLGEQRGKAQNKCVECEKRTALFCEKCNGKDIELAMKQGSGMACEKCEQRAVERTKEECKRSTTSLLAAARKDGFERGLVEQLTKSRFNIIMSRIILGAKKTNYEKGFQEGIDAVGLRPELLEFAKEMEAKFKRCDKTKGDSWKTMRMIDLEYGLRGEYEEYRGAGEPHQLSEEYGQGELIDIANYCMMLYNRKEAIAAARKGKAK